MVHTKSDLDNFLRVFAPAKINLHLEILGIRNDGFHELAMVMQSIDLVDELDIKNRNDGTIRLSTDNHQLTTSTDNLIIKAADILSKNTKCSNLGADIHLRKRIPIGAGLAGGSSNGAAALVGLNIVWGLGFSDKEINEFAAELGSDMPFCLKGGTQLCFGRGEVLESLPASQSSMGILLVKDPKVSVSTPWAYKRYKEINKSRYMQSELEYEKRREVLRKRDWFNNLSANNPISIRNDLQQVVAPEIESVSKSLKSLMDLPGSLAVSMSGSGPSCFALFSNYNEAKAVAEKSKHSLQKLGLDSWCCSLISNGVSWKR